MVTYAYLYHHKSNLNYIVRPYLKIIIVANLTLVLITCQPHCMCCLVLYPVLVIEPDKEQYSGVLPNNPSSFVLYPEKKEKNHSWGTPFFHALCSSILWSLRSLLGGENCSLLHPNLYFNFQFSQKWFLLCHTRKKSY